MVLHIATFLVNATWFKYVFGIYVLHLKNNNLNQSKTFFFFLKGIFLCSCGLTNKIRWRRVMSGFYN